MMRVLTRLVKRHGAQYWLVIVTETPDGTTFAVPAHYWSAVWPTKALRSGMGPPDAAWVKERGIADPRDAAAIAAAIAEAWPRATSNLPASFLEALGEDLLDTARVPACEPRTNELVGAGAVGMGIGVALAIAAGPRRSTRPARAWDMRPVLVGDVFDPGAIPAGLTVIDQVTFGVVREGKEWSAHLGARQIGTIQHASFGGGWWTVVPSAVGEVEELCITRRRAVSWLLTHLAPAGPS